MKVKIYIFLSILCIGAYFLLPLFLKESKKQLPNKTVFTKKTKKILKKPQKKNLEFDLKKKVKENYVEIVNLKILTTDLRKKISMVKNNKVMPQILWYFFHLEDNVTEGKDVRKKIMRLKILTKKDEFLQGKFLELEKEIANKFISQKQLLKNFNSKVSLLISNSENNDGLINKWKSVMAKYISVRKVRFNKEDEGTNEFLIFQIEKAIEEQNYSASLGFVQKLKPSQIDALAQEIQQLKKLNNINKALAEIRFYLEDFLINSNSL